MTSGNPGKSIAQLSVLIQSGALDPVALAEETLDGIRGYKDQSVFIALTPERAMVEAKASSERIKDGRSLGLLDGIPIAWKDLFDLDGMTTTAGSVILADAPKAARDAAVVTALKSAGMVAIGRTNMTEFAFSGLGINPHYGTPENPHSTDEPRIPGGSSSGAGVAIAAGLVPVAMGSDTGGSVRIPAAFNGIVGYKATRGRYSMDGVFPLSKSLDSLGPLCRTVQDAVWIDAAMRGLTASDVRRRSLEGVSLVVPETVFFDEIEPEVASSFEAALARLSKAGAKIRRQAFPEFAAIFELYANHGPLVTAEAYALHRERLDTPEAATMDRIVAMRMRLGTKTAMTDYVALLEARERMIASLSRQIDKNEIIVSPTLPHVAPPIAPLTRDDDLFFKTNGKTLRNTLIGNFLDWCGVSIPCGIGAAGMPVGLLLSGLPNTDEHLLGVALAAEDIVRADMANVSITTDVAAHHADWNVLYAAYADYYKVQQDQAMRDRTWGWINEGRIICLMALDAEGRPVGLAHLREFLRPLSSTVAGYLDDLFVDPSQRGGGVVDQLFDAASAIGREKNWSVIRWITRDDNYRARSVYDRIATRTNWVTYDLTP